MTQKTPLWSRAGAAFQRRKCLFSLVICVHGFLSSTNSYLFRHDTSKYDIHNSLIVCPMFGATVKYKHLPSGLMPTQTNSSSSSVLKPHSTSTSSSENSGTPLMIFRAQCKCSKPINGRIEEGKRKTCSFFSLEKSNKATWKTSCQQTRRLLDNWLMLPKNIPKG